MRARNKIGLEINANTEKKSFFTQNVLSNNPKKLLLL